MISIKSSKESRPGRSHNAKHCFIVARGIQQKAHVKVKNKCSRREENCGYDELTASKHPNPVNTPISWGSLLLNPDSAWTSAVADHRRAWSELWKFLTLEVMLLMVPFALPGDVGALKCDDEYGRKPQAVHSKGVLKSLHDRSGCIGIGHFELSSELLHLGDAICF
jgi:hypothetical protein